MKSQFSFCILRYVHDAVTGEFVNVGVVVTSPDLGFVGGKFENRYRRLSDLFARSIDGRHFRRMLQSIEKRLRELSDTPALARSGFSEATKLARSILPLDDSALQFHPGGAGVTESPENTLDYLFGRYVTKYILGQERTTRTDDDVLTALKRSLDQAKLGTEVHPYPFSSRAFEHTFPISWVNGRTNLCQPLSFDLLESESIRNKAYRWAGRSRSIHEHEPDVRLVFFLGLPVHTAQNEGYRDGKEILSRYVEGDALVLDETQTEELIHEVQNH